MSFLLRQTEAGHNIILDALLPLRDISGDRFSGELSECPQHILVSSCDMAAAF